MFIPLNHEIIRSVMVIISKIFDFVGRRNYRRWSKNYYSFYLIFCVFLHFVQYSMQGDYIQGLLPMVQCFSCMSKSLQDDFQYLSRIYLPQQTFDDRCNEPFMDKNMPVVNCSNICVTLKESEQTFGVVFGHNYIRGCIDKIFVNGFLNRTAIETHRFYFDDVCRALPWEQLMTSDFIKKPSNNKHNNYKSGDVILCSCYGNKCNGANSARKLGQLSSCRTLVTASLGFIIIFYLMLRF